MSCGTHQLLINLKYSFIYLLINLSLYNSNFRQKKIIYKIIFFYRSDKVKKLLTQLICTLTFRVC